MFGWVKYWAHFVGTLNLYFVTPDAMQKTKNWSDHPGLRKRPKTVENWTKSNIVIFLQFLGVFPAQDDWTNFSSFALHLSIYNWHWIQSNPLEIMISTQKSVWKICPVPQDINQNVPKSGHQTKLAYFLMFWPKSRDQVHIFHADCFEYNELCKLKNFSFKGVNIKWGQDQHSLLRYSSNTFNAAPFVQVKCVWVTHVRGVLSG